MTLSSSTGFVKLSLNQAQMTIDTADDPIAQTKAKVMHEKSQAVSREIGAALARIENRRHSAEKNEVR